MAWLPQKRNMHDSVPLDRWTVSWVEEAQQRCLLSAKGGVLTTHALTWDGLYKRPRVVASERLSSCFALAPWERLGRKLLRSSRQALGFLGQPQLCPNAPSEDDARAPPAGTLQNHRNPPWPRSGLGCCQEPCSAASLPAPLLDTCLGSRAQQPGTPSSFSDSSKRAPLTRASRTGPPSHLLGKDAVSPKCRRRTPPASSVGCCSRPSASSAQTTAALRGAAPTCVSSCLASTAAWRSSSPRKKTARPVCVGELRSGSISKASVSICRKRNTAAVPGRLSEGTWRGASSSCHNPRRKVHKERRKSSAGISPNSDSLHAFSTVAPAEATRNQNFVFGCQRTKREKGGITTKGRKHV